MQVGDMLVFTARIAKGHHSLPMGTKIVVTFTDSYCVAAHERCYGFEESAPRLFAHTQLPNGWHMVVMEHLEGRAYGFSGETAAVKEQLRSIVAHLHAGGLVRGDLRAFNT
jgi:tRNA A-37 threonylcarbamoyl transferase component Bud32